MKDQKLIRGVIGMLSILGLVAVFLFQKMDIVPFVNAGEHPLEHFLINRTIRFVVNDILAIGLIYALFKERKYVLFSLWVQGFGVLFFLMPYFILKAYFPSYNGPLISFIHRLILNPTLLLLLIPAFYFQKHNLPKI